uniref:Uncharacterized protein n=1 Tax=Panagrolaimus sp. JU765 TaxID=591449 RepID=A0AC34REH4_9BILA
MVIFAHALIFLASFSVVFGADNDTATYSNSVLSIESITIQLTAFYVNFTQFNFRISVSSDKMQPVYAWVDPGSLINNNTFAKSYTQDFRFNISNPANFIYLDGILDFNPPFPQNQTTTFVRLLTLDKDNSTNVWNPQTVKINNAPNMNYVSGFLTFNYQKSCATENAYGFACRQCNAKLSEDNGTCYTCDAHSGENICCSGYFSPSCINSTKITDLKAEHRITEARIRREQMLYEQSPFRGDPLGPPSPRLRPPPGYIPPPPREESPIPQNSPIRQVQPTFPRTSPHYSQKNSHQTTHSRNYSIESDDDWRYATGAEHVV